MPAKRCFLVPALSVALVAMCPAASTPRAPEPVGEFADHGDVGATVGGSAGYDRTTGEYRVTGGGENIWGAKDRFHFAWRKVQGDVTMTADVRFVGEGKNPHRKACVMVRQGLDIDDAYADVAVHGDGLISLQFRRAKGGQTEEIKSPVKAPAAVRLERKGDVFTVSVAPDGKAFEKVGSITLPITAPAYAGLAVCSHDAAVTETAVFSRVKIQTP